MKVCFVSHSASKGGAERALIELVDALRQQDVESCIILPAHGMLTKEFEIRGIPISVIPYEWWMNGTLSMRDRIRKLRGHLRAARRVAEWVLEWQCDVVYTNTITICVGAIAANLTRRPHVWHIHEYGSEHHGLKFEVGYRLALWIMDRSSSVCIANSKAVAQKYSEYIGAEKLRVVYQSVTIPPADASLESALQTAGHAAVRYVVVGSIQRGKRQEDAIRAVGELARGGVPAELVIVGVDGDSAYRTYLNELIREQGLESLVRFVGYVDSPYSLIRQATALVSCSVFESFGRVVVEAMLLGVPVIGASSGATAELIRDGHNGLLYTPGDNKELANKLKFLIEHPDVAQSLAREAQRWAVERFSEDRYGREIHEVLAGILRERR